MIITMIVGGLIMCFVFWAIAMAFLNLLYEKEINRIIRMKPEFRTDKEENILKEYRRRIGRGEQ